MEAIIRKESGAQPSYFVRDPVDCGMEVHDPGYNLSGHTLTLTYSTHLPANGDVAACACEYNASFKFQKLPSSVDTVRFRQH